MYWKANGVPLCKDRLAGWLQSDIQAGPVWMRRPEDLKQSAMQCSAVAIVLFFSDSRCVEPDYGIAGQVSLQFSLSSKQEMNNMATM